MKARLNLQEYANGIAKGDRVVLAKAITLVESTLPVDRALADQLIEKILPRTGNSIRIGITGVPGVGKSTFIEAFGKHIIETHKKKLAILTVDPSSPLTKGSILGDKTRMEELSRNMMAFVRPSSSGEAVGGITHRTREAIHLCEAAGFEIIIVETVGVGQSEVAVKKSVDFFLLLMLAGAGDELQGIKKGIMEMADVVAITKADGENKNKANEARSEYQHALHLFRPDVSGWSPKVLTCSALLQEGMDAIWNTIVELQQLLQNQGLLEYRRNQQQVEWMHECFDQLLKQQFEQSASLQKKNKHLENEVLNRRTTPQQAAQSMLSDFIELLRTTKS
ncbi:MAG: methylmalonyl Co-A mutase-associated GTPase MeaB [Cyclobacteriaceae bacterium]|nr:methylmalonyl Co-A mutase-associated GTPase MeaB [Cyclobacteriaceae bacterium]